MKSIFSQLEAYAVEPRLLMESPRHWNAGLLRYGSRLWMCYRYHLKEAGGRCATAIVELDDMTFQPVGESQRLLLSGPTGDEHHEDARLFTYQGRVHISYTEMRGYRPGVDYTCVMKYARLEFRGGQWQVLEVFHPDYGRNDGRFKEKNWVFFEGTDGKLYAVYSGHPEHRVIQLDGHRVVAEHTTDAPLWHFGEMRGGTPPLLQSDGTYLSIFHSSLPTEEAPHYVRYYAGAYVFEGTAPFKPIAISTRPLLSGSEEDGHRHDPRNVDGWKPFCVFPCGMMPEGEDRWLVSLGLNDWASVIADVRRPQLMLGKADGSTIPARYFRTENPTMPIRLMDDQGRPVFVPWTAEPLGLGGARSGVMECKNPRHAQEVSDRDGVIEIQSEDYGKSLRKQQTY